MPSTLRSLIEKHLAQIKEAINSYKIIGIKAITEVLHAAYGEVLVNEDVYAEGSQSDELSILGKIWRNMQDFSAKIVTTDKILSSSSGVIDKGIRALEYIEKIIHN